MAQHVQRRVHRQRANAGTGAADNSWTIVGIGDFNGDHISDLLWRNDSGYVTEWLGTSTGAFVSNEANAGTNSVDSSWHVAGIGDFNGDGRSDVLWRNDSGYVTEWVGNANGGFTSNQANAGTGAAPASSTIAGIGDFNGDGKADLLWRASDGTITDWLGQANGGFVDNSAVASQPLDLSLKIDGVGDFNGDGTSDVLIQWSDGTLQTWVGSDTGAILSPMEKQWEDAIAGVHQMVDEINYQLATAPPPTSDKDLGTTGLTAIPTPIATDGFSMFGAATSVGDANGFFPGLSTGADSSFGLSFLTDTSFGFTFEDNSGYDFDALSLIDSSTSTFSIVTDGIDLVGSWLLGAPPASEPSLDLSSDAIVITGTRYDNTALTWEPSGYFNFQLAYNGNNFLDGFGGGFAAHYTPAGNAWANAHINLIGKTQADVHASNVMHDALARFFDWAKANPNAPIQIGNGTTVTASTALANFNEVMINVQSTGGGDNGGEIQPNTTGGAIITINPENSTFASEYAKYGGDAVTNYALFHELGHQLDNVNAHSMYLSTDSESFANTGGRSMEDYLQITLASFPENNPPFGYK